MHVLYLDDAGSATNPNQRHFVLAGIAIFERQIHWLIEALNRTAAATGHVDPASLELHGSHMHGGKGPWRKIPRELRRQTIRDGLGAASTLRSKRQWRLFGVVVDKAALSPEDPIEYAFEQLANRFDRFIARNYRQSGHPDRGLIVLDKSTRETRLQTLAAEFKTSGHRWGMLHNLADVPFFVDSKATRLIQYADLVAYAMWRRFEERDSQYFDVISGDFDTEGGVVHGLHHYTAPGLSCDCPSCASRQ